MRSRSRVCIAVVVVLLLSALAGNVVAQEAVPPTGPDPVAPIEILQNVILVILQVAIPPLLAWGMAEVKRYVDTLRADARYRHLYYAVESAVTAAEQLGLTDQLAQYGEDKLQVAIRFVERQLAAAGVPLDVDEYADAIRAMIEAEVRRQFPGESEPTRAWIDEDGDGGRQILGGEA